MNYQVWLHNMSFYLRFFFCVKKGKVENHWRFRRLSHCRKLNLNVGVSIFSWYRLFGLFLFFRKGKGGGAIYQVVMGNITIRMKINSNFLFDRHCTKKLVVILVQGIHYGLLRITQVWPETHITCYLCLWYDQQLWKGDSFSWCESR